MIGNKNLSNTCSEHTGYYDDWHKSAIQLAGGEYHLVNDGVLTRKDFTVLFENESGKKYIPVETADMLNIYSDVILSGEFLSYIGDRRIGINVFDHYGNFKGSYMGNKTFGSIDTLLNQVDIYRDEKARLAVAKEIEIAAFSNMATVIRYYRNKMQIDALDEILAILEDGITKMKKAEDINRLMLIEAIGRQHYYRLFNIVIINRDFVFNGRSKRPPLDEVNAMISFGNAILYNKVASEIQKTTLDGRIGFLHSVSTRRSTTLNLDLAEIFKPIIVDRVILSMINHHQINVDSDFVRTEEGGVYLSKTGKTKFIRAIENKLMSSVSIAGEKKTYGKLLREEVVKIRSMVNHNKRYRAYRQSN